MQQIFIICALLASSLLVKAQGSTNVTTANPCNLSWVVAECDFSSIILRGNEYEATVAPQGCPSLQNPLSVKVSKDCQKQYNFKKGELWLLVIREGYISSAYPAIVHQN